MAKETKPATDKKQEEPKDLPPPAPQKEFVYRQRFDGVLGIKVGDKRLSIPFNHRTFTINDNNIEAFGRGCTIEEVCKGIETSGGFGVDRFLVAGTGVKVSDDVKQYDKEIMSGIQLTAGAQGARPA